MTGLEWNVAQRAQEEAQRRAELAPREKAEAERRAALKQSIPAREQLIAAGEAELTRARAELAEREREQAAARADWLRAYHAATGGQLPRLPSGEYVLLTPMAGMHPEALAEVPAKREWERFKECEARTLRAGAAVRALEAGLFEHRGALEMCKNA